METMQAIAIGAVAAGILLAAVLLLKGKSRKSKRIIDPPIAGELFSSTRWSIIWVPLRLYIGYTWLEAGLEKTISSSWLSGEAIQGFFSHAVSTTAGKPAISYGFYRSFIQGLLDSGQFQTYAKAIMAAEIIIGICLILGAFTGIAAFIGGFMNWNFMMAGAASINPLMFLFSILLIMAWKTSGYTGLDRWLLPKIGTPWQKNIGKV